MARQWTDVLTAEERMLAGVQRWARYAYFLGDRLLLEKVLDGRVYKRRADTPKGNRDGVDLLCRISTTWMIDIDWLGIAQQHRSETLTLSWCVDV